MVGMFLKFSLSERIQSVRVSVDFVADFCGKCQNDEAKYNICSVLNDTSHFRCLVTKYKVKILNLRHSHDRPLTHPAVSSRGGPTERRKSSLILDVLILQNLACL